MPKKTGKRHTAHSTQHLLKELKDFLREMQDDLNEMERRIDVSEARNELIREMDKAILRSTFSPQEVLELIIEKCLSKTGSQHGQVVQYVQYGRNRLIVTASSEPDRVGQELPLERSLCGKAVLEGKPQHYADVRRVPSGKYVRYHAETKSELVVLIKPELTGRILGVLDLERDKLGRFDPTSVAFSELLAGQAAIAIGHARTWSGVNTLYEISTSLLSGNLTLGESYQKILDAILDRFDFEHGQILRLIESEFVILASSRREDIGLRAGRDTSVCGRYLIAEEERDTLVINNIDDSLYREFYLGLLQDEGNPMRSELIVPLIENDRLIGALNIESPQIDIFSELDKTLLGVVGSLIATSISATLARRTRVNRERVDSATLALTQLGNVAQSFLHRFGSGVGNAKARLGELRTFLSSKQLPNIRDDGETVNSFISGVTDTLGEAVRAIDAFSERFNPEDPGFKIQEMDLKLVAGSALELARGRHAQDAIEFRLEDRMPSPKTQINQDASGLSACYLSQHIFEVIENLLDNAVEAIIDRGGAFADGEVTMVLDLPDPFQMRLQVKDNGIGIVDSEKDRIFQFGYTTRKKRRSSHGIGLWFCDLYVRQRGGRISFISTAGEGTTFEVLLPTVLSDVSLL